MPPMQLPTTYDEARDAIAARPLGATQLALRATIVANAGGSSRDVDASVPVHADVRVGAYLDLPDADVPISWSTLERWGVTIETVLDDVRRRLPKTPPGAIDGVTGVAVLDHPTLAACMLRDATLHSVFLPRKLQPFVLAVTPHHLITADARRPDAIARAAELAIEAVRSDARLASITPLTHDGFTWRATEWPDEAEEAATRLRHHADQRVYGDAKRAVDAAHERMGLDVTVAALQLGARPGGETVTMTSLVEDAGRTFLPAADVVALVRLDGTTTPVPLARLRQVPGLLRPVDGLVPEYLEATRYPDELG